MFGNMLNSLPSKHKNKRKTKKKFNFVGVRFQKAKRSKNSFECVLTRFKCGVASPHRSSYNYKQFTNILHVSKHLHSVVNHYNVLFGFPIARISSTESTEKSVQLFKFLAKLPCCCYHIVWKLVPIDSFGFKVCFSRWKIFPF